MGIQESICMAFFFFFFGNLVLQSWPLSILCSWVLFSCIWILKKKIELGKYWFYLYVIITLSIYAEPVFSGSIRYGGMLEHDGGSSTTLADGHKIAQVFVVYYVGAQRLLVYYDYDWWTTSYLAGMHGIAPFLFHIFSRNMCCACSPSSIRPPYWKRSFNWGICIITVYLVDVVLFSSLPNLKEER